MTKIVGICKSLIWENNNKFRFKFSTSATTTSTRIPPFEAEDWGISRSRLDEFSGRSGHVAHLDNILLLNMVLLEFGQYFIPAIEKDIEDGEDIPRPEIIGAKGNKIYLK